MIFLRQQPLTVGYPLGAILASPPIRGLVRQRDRGNTSNPVPVAHGWIGNFFFFCKITAGAVVSRRPTTRESNFRRAGRRPRNTIGADGSLKTPAGLTSGGEPYGWRGPISSNNAMSGPLAAVVPSFILTQRQQAVQVLIGAEGHIAGWTRWAWSDGQDGTACGVLPRAINQAGSLIGETSSCADSSPSWRRMGTDHRITSHDTAKPRPSGGGPQTGNGNGSVNNLGSTDGHHTTGDHREHRPAAARAHKNLPLALTGTWYVKL